jgi:hypothetical protein
MDEKHVPLCLKHVREEVLMALGAASAESEVEHRKLAEEYLAEVVNVIEHEPERQYDWSELLDPD